MALAAGLNGTGSFRSLARSLKYPVGGFQTPDKSGFPSGKRGAGAARFGLPSGVRGIVLGGSLVHNTCATSDSDDSNKATRTGKIFNDPFAFIGICIKPSAMVRRLYRKNLIFTERFVITSMHLWGWNS